jgi:5-methylcytosine-specific restriction endonuclease McrA
MVKDFFGRDIVPLSERFGPSSKNSERDSRRAFTQSQRNDIWDKQNGKCARCKKPLLRSATHYDHKKPWEKGGKTEVKNGQALCANCHSIKSNHDRLKKVDKKRKSKSNNRNGFGALDVRLPRIRPPRINNPFI